MNTFPCLMLIFNVVLFYSLFLFFSFQIVLYCIARCVASLLPRETVSADYPASKVIPIEKKTFSIFAALVWGCVMWLFKNRRQRLQGSLVSSMDCECVQRRYFFHHESCARNKVIESFFVFCPRFRPIYQCREMERVSIHLKGDQL